MLDQRMETLPVPQSNNPICKVGVDIVGKGACKSKICKLQISLIVNEKIGACKVFSM